MADDKGINIPVTLNITGITGDIDINEIKPRKNQFPKRKNPVETRRDTAKYGNQTAYFRMVNSAIRYANFKEANKARVDSVATKFTNDISKINEKLIADIKLLTTKDINKAHEFDRKKWLVEFNSMANELKYSRSLEIENVKARNRRSFMDKKYHQDIGRALRKKQYDLERIDARANARMRVDNNRYQKMWDLSLKKENLRKQKEEERFNSQFGMNGLYNRLRNGFAKIGLPLDDVRDLWLGGLKKKNISPERMGVIKGNLKAFGIGTAITAGVSAVTFLTKKTFSTLLSTSKKIVGVFTDAAKQAETFKTIMNLALAPIITMFTLLFVPMLIAMVPLIKTMFDWVLSNKEAIMAVGDKLGTIFNAENLNIVGKALDGILFVLDALANIFSTNASMIDTSSLTRFISSTVLVITNMIQDIMMSIIAFCYSPEGQAFIKSVAYSVGEIIGSIFTTIVTLLPVMAESVFYSIIGFISGIGSMISKAIFNLFDVIDNFTGGAISGFLNTIVNLINTAINALNNINIFGFNPFNIPTLNGGSVGQIGSSVNNFADQSIVNNFNVNNMMSISSPSVLKDVMSTGVY